MLSFQDSTLYIRLIWYLIKYKKINRKWYALDLPMQYVISFFYFISRKRQSWGRICSAPFCSTNLLNLRSHIDLFAFMHNLCTRMAGEYDTSYAEVVTASGLQLRLLYLHFGNPGRQWDRLVVGLVGSYLEATACLRNFRRVYTLYVVPCIPQANFTNSRCIDETSSRVIERSAYALCFNLLALRIDVWSRYHRCSLPRSFT